MGKVANQCREANGHVCSDEQISVFKGEELWSHDPVGVESGWRRSMKTQRRRSSQADRSHAFTNRKILKAAAKVSQFHRQEINNARAGRRDHTHTHTHRPSRAFGLCRWSV